MWHSEVLLREMRSLPSIWSRCLPACAGQGIVKSVKGSQGGYLLKYPSSSITVASIIQALEGTYYLDDEETKTEESAAGIAETIQEDIVDRVNHGLDQILQNLTLADLEESFQERQSGGQEMYYI